MQWLISDWDQGHVVAFVVGCVAGIALALLGSHGLAELGGVVTAAGVRWALWQIPPPGRPRGGTPDDGWSRLGQITVAVLLVVLVVDLAAAPLA